MLPEQDIKSNTNARTSASTSGARLPTEAEVVEGCVKGLANHADDPAALINTASVLVQRIQEKGGSHAPRAQQIVSTALMRFRTEGQSPTPVLNKLFGLFNYDPTPPSLPIMVRVLLCVLVITHDLIDLLPWARPIIQFSGPPASTKTSAARAVARSVDGPDANVRTAPSTERDFWPIVARYKSCIFDNVERTGSYFTDALASAATGGAGESRRLYTDDDVVTLKAKGILGLTSYSAGVTRGDLLSRSVIIRLAVPTEFIPDSEFRDIFAADGNALRREIEEAAGIVRERVAACRPRAPAGCGRLADFAALGTVIADVTGGALDTALFEFVLAHMQVERERLGADGNIFLAALLSWAENAKNRDARTEKAGRWVTSGQILDYLGQATGVGFISRGPGDAAKPFENTRLNAHAFGRFLSDLRRDADGLLNVETRQLHGRVHYRVTRRGR